MVVDADRVLPAAIAFQRLETIGGRNAKIGKALRRIEQTQLAQGDSLNVSGKVPAAAALPDRCRLLVAKARDHSSCITHNVMQHKLNL
jgi:hypothetical protein